MCLPERLEMIRSKEDLADLVPALCSDFKTNPTAWENDTLDRFLDAMQDWIRSSDAYYRNAGQECPELPTWRTFAEILCAARIYE
jgi:hypothetical protein